MRPEEQDLNFKIRKIPDGDGEIRKIWWPTTRVHISALPSTARQKQNARVKSKTLASKAKQSRQKQNHRVKSKTVASKHRRPKNVGKFRARAATYCLYM